MNRCPLFLFVLGSLLAMSCGSEEDPPDGPLPPFILASSDNTIFPDRTPADVVSWAEHLVPFKVLSEERLEFDQGVKTRGEGLVGRRITVEFGQLIWSNRLARPLPKQASWIAFGWILKEGTHLVPLVPRNAARLEVGGGYIAPILGFGLSELVASPVWAPMTVHAVVPQKGDEIATHDISARLPLVGIGAVFAPLDPAEMRRILDEAPRDPALEPFMHLPPEDRLRAVRAARAGGGTPPTP